MFKRFLPHGLTYIQDLLKLVFAVCLFTTLLTSLALAVNLYIGNYIQQSEVFAFVRMLVFADSLGILLLFPIYQGWQHRFNLTLTELKWLGAGFAALVTIFALVAVDMAYAIFFILPVLLVLAFNIKLFELGMVMALSMATVTAFTAADMGPLISDIELETNFRLMSFLFASSLTILGIALQNQQLALSEDLVATWKDAATTDSLTGILNRRAFFSLSRNEVQRINLEERPSYSIAMLDLDQFKYINDTHGHAVGDLVLREFAQLLQSHCRKVDIAARVGGEEFAVFLPQCSRDYATRVMNRIREALAMHSFTVGHKTIDVTVSIGVASLQNNSDTLDDVLTRADLALYQAKGKRNRVVTSADGDLIP